MKKGSALRKETNRGALSAVSVSMTVILALAYWHDSLFFLHLELFVKEKPWFAALFMLALFVLKAFLPLFLPLFALYTMTGRLFSDDFLSVAVNLFGMALMVSLVYALGRMKTPHAWGKGRGRLASDTSKTEAVKRAKKKRARQKKNKTPPASSPTTMEDERQKAGGLISLVLLKYHEFRQKVRTGVSTALSKHTARSLFLFTLSPFPFGFLGKLCGENSFSFPLYLLLTLAGCLPRLLCATLLGMSLDDPSLPGFYFSFALTVFVSVGSLLLFFRGVDETETPLKE